MKGLAEYFNNIYTNCEIPFEIVINEKNIYNADPSYDESDMLESSFFVGLYNVKLRVPSKYKDSIKLLEFCIRDRWKENSTDSEKMLMDLLENISISDEKINENMPVLNADSYFIVLNVEEKIKEAIEILKNIYHSMDTLIISKDNYIVLLGSFENIGEHITSISETIYTSIYKKCYIVYENITSYENVKNLYDDSIKNILVAKKYNISKMVLDGNSLIFESIIEGLADESKVKIVDKFRSGFEKMDNDMIRTIEVFFETDLNLSEASKKLYVHRNTLIYRLEKIEKYTSYDIRKFNDAVIFKIAFFLWKQS